MWNDDKVRYHTGFPGRSAGKESACNVGDLGSIPGLGRSPEKRTLPTLVFWPGEFHGLYSPQTCKESDTTERLSLSLSTFSFHICYILLFSHSVVLDSFVTPWTVAHQNPLSTGFPREEYWSGLPFPSPEDLPDSGIGPVSPALAGGSLTSEQLGKSYVTYGCVFAR